MLFSTNHYNFSYLNNEKSRRWSWNSNTSLNLICEQQREHSAVRQWDWSHWWDPPARAQIAWEHRLGSRILEVFQEVEHNSKKCIQIVLCKLCYNLVDINIQVIAQYYPNIQHPNAFILKLLNVYTHGPETAQKTFSKIYVQQWKLSLSLLLSGGNSAQTKLLML